MLGECSHTNYFWSPKTGLSDAAIAQPQLNALESNVYLLTAEESGCITRDTFRLRVIDPIPLFELKNNPVQEALFLYFDDKSMLGAQLNLFDVLGRLLYRVEVLEEKSSWKIPTDQLVRGNYLIQMVLGDQNQTEVFLKN